MLRAIETNSGRPAAAAHVMRLVTGALLTLAVLVPASRAAEPVRATRRVGALPDTVLARVGTSRDVTLSEFRSAWAQLRPPARPDTLTPQHAGEFLDLLIDRELLGQRALEAALPWTPAESLQFRAYRDNLVLRSFLDSLMRDLNQRWMAAGDTTRDSQALGVALRDTVLAGLSVEFDEPLSERLAARWAALPRPSSDSSVSAQIRMMGALPVVDPADTGRVLARDARGEFRVSELLEHWRRTDPFARPRVNEASQIQDLAKNGLFERWLRAGAERERIDQRPASVAALASRRELFAVTRLVEREVYDRLKSDSLTLRRWYDSHADDYSIPDRARVVQLVLPTRAAASEMFVQLRDATAAESLLARGRRAGVEYHAEISAESDSALLRAAYRAGPGAVLGPDSTRGGWRVARVRELVPARRRTFEEAQVIVERHFQAVEGERLMQEWLTRLRKGTVVKRNAEANRLAAGSP